MHLLDKSFFFTDTEASPKHVAGRILLKCPEGQQESLDSLVDQLRQCGQAEFPFNSKISSRLGWPTGMHRVEQLDMDYHVKLHEIEDCNDKALLDAFLGQLHEQQMDRQQPMWQCHVVKGKVNTDYFVLYVKIHHAYGDGILLMKRVMSSFSQTPDQAIKPFWTKAKKSHPTERRTRRALRAWVSSKSWLLSSLHMLLILLRSFASVLRISNNFFTLPFSAPKTAINGQVRAGRCVASATISMQRIMALSKTSKASVNDLMLCVTDKAIRRLLADLEDQYGRNENRKRLICMMPINLRLPSDESEGNKIAIVLLPLANLSAAPGDVLAEIQQQDTKVKTIARRYTPLALMHYTMLYQSLGILFEKLHLFDWCRPINNVLLSNLKGPETPHFFGLHRIVSISPISIVPPGGGINMSVLSYDGHMHLGMVACSSMVPDLASFSEYVLDAFEQLEAQYCASND